MKRFVCLLLSGILGCIVCLAEVSGRDDDPTGKHRFGLNGALTSSDTWQMEMEYHYLRPSLVLISPALLKIRDAKIKLLAEPGIMMNVPYQCVGIDIYENGVPVDYVTRSSSKGQWCAIDCRAGVNVTIGPING